MAKKGRIEQTQPPGAPLVPLTVLGVAVVVYLMAFYVVEPIRLKYLLTPTLPDQVWDDWTAGAWPRLFDRCWIWVLAGYYAGVANCAGRLILRMLGVKELSQVERFVFAMSLGLAALSTLTLLVGLAGGLHVPWAFRIGSVVIILAEAFLSFRGPKPPAIAEQETSQPALVIGHWSLVILSAICFLAAVLPPTDFDVLEYHLQVPKEWFQAGRIDFLPHNVYGNMPLGSEMHALGCMELWLGNDAWWHGALAGKVIIASFGPLTALALYAAARRWLSQPVGVIAAAVYLTFPWIAHVSFNGLVDGVLAHYTFLAVYAATIAGVDWRKHVLAGLLAGGAAACKYPGLIFAGMPVVAILVVQSWMLSKERRAASTALSLGCALAGLAIVVGPWYAKNAVLANNPVYPLAAKLLDGKTRTPEKIDQWNRAHRVPEDENKNRYSLTQIWSAKKSAGLTSQWLSPIAWPLAMVGLLAAWRKRELWPLLATAAWIFVVWFVATHRIDRFWLPAVPFLCLSAGAAWTWSEHAIYRRAVIIATSIGAFAAVLMIIAPIYDGDRRIDISNPHWLTSLERLRTEGASPSHQELNKLAKEGQAVLLVGDATPFDLEMPVYYNTCFDDCLLELYTKGRPTDEIHAEFHERRIAYVLVDWGEIARYRSDGNYGFTRYVQPEVFARLMEAGILEPPVERENEGRWEIYPVP